MTTATDLSLGEFRALSAKAFRGAGYCWGVIEDASFAAKRLAEFGLPAADLVVSLLTTVDGLETDSLMPRDLADDHGTIVCPVCLGLCLADNRNDTVRTSFTFANVVAPALVAPLVTMGLEPGDNARYVIEWDGGSCEASETSIVMSGGHPDHAVDVQIFRRQPALDPGQRHDRVVLPAHLLEALETFAHRTYAPNTEASRIAGAGPS